MANFKYDQGKTLSDNLDAFEEWKSQGDWKPANNGTEVPFLTRAGITLLYCYQPRSGKHGYLNVGTDIILSYDEALNYLCA